MAEEAQNAVNRETLIDIDISTSVPTHIPNVLYKPRFQERQ